MLRLPRHVRPLRYSLSLAVDPARERYSGEVAIELELDRPVRAITLHAVDLDVRAAAAHGKGGDVAARKWDFEPESETLTVRLASALPAGRATLTIAFDAALRRDLRGLYLARSGERRYAVTQLEATDARRFFPCFDEPDRKARFALRATVPAGLQAISNGRTVSAVKKGRSQVVTFAETPPLSTYLVALVVGALEGSRTVRAGKTPIRVWCVPGKKHLAELALEVAAASLTRLERWFGIPYAYGKLDLLAVPDFEFGAMENAGAVTFRETLLLCDPKTVTALEKKRIAEVICHELAHMWYGNLVTMAWWDDLWLNEAFATWMAFKIVDEWRPDLSMWLEFEHARAPAYELDALANTHPIYTPVRRPSEATENFDKITYEKGASVVRMLECWLGEAAFRRGVQRYVRRHREANARAADLWAALEEASGQPVEHVVRAWIERPGHPLVRARRTDRGGKARLSLTQERCSTSPRPQAGRGERWPIPLLVRVARAGQRGTRVERLLVERASETLELGRSAEVRWGYVNAEGAAFLRPVHEGALLGALRADLARLAPVERMALFGAQWTGVRAGRAELGDLLDLALSLGDEREPTVLEAAAGPLAWIDDQLVPALPKDAAQRWRARIAAAFRPALAELGWLRRRGDPETAGARRAILLGLALGLGEDAELGADCAARIRAYLRKRSAVDPDLAQPLVLLAARAGDAALHARYLAAMRGAATPQERVRFAGGLTAFRAPALVRRTLALLLDDEIPAQDVVPLLVRAFDNPAAREAAWSFVQKRWKPLSRRVSSGLAPRLVSALPALQTPARKREVAAFFRAHPLPTAARALKQALERFDRDAELRRRLARPFADWVRGAERA